MKKVLFLTTIPSPYRVAFFNEWGKSVDLTVLFEKRSSSERDGSWKQYRFDHFSGVFMKGIGISPNTAFSPQVLKYLNRDWDEIICSNISTPTGMLAIQYMKLRKIPYWIEGDGGFPKNGRGIKEKVKVHFFSGAKGYFSTGKEHDRYYLTYGAKREKLHRYPFTSISQDYIDRASAPYSKEDLKKQLGIPEKFVIVTVGQFIPRKGFDMLLRASKSFPENTGVYYIGGEPTVEYLRLVEDLQLQQQTHFVGFKKSEQLMDYYRAADLFILPTREDIWGLVINEAMAFSLPVITTDRCIAGLELVGREFIVPVDDADAISETVDRLLNDPEWRSRTGQRNLQTVSGYTIEKMAAAHNRILQQEEQMK